MGKEKIALAICFCLIVALAGFSAWLYVGANGLENKVSDLENKVVALETQNVELNEKVQNLTNWRDAFMGALTFTFMQTEELTFTSYTWGASNVYIDLTVKNTGSGALTISDVQVGGVSADDVSITPAALDPGDSASIRITQSFTSGVKYEFTVITATGNTFGPYIKTAP